MYVSFSLTRQNKNVVEKINKLKWCAIGHSKCMIFSPNCVSSVCLVCNV